MDKEFVDFLDKKFNKIDEKFDKIDERFDKVDEKFAEARRYTDEKFEESKRHFGVIAEGLRGEIRQVAEGHGLLHDQIETLRQETKEEIASVRKEIEILRKEFIEHRLDNEKAFKDLLSAIKFSYADLDHRMTSMEAELQALRIRIERLEAQGGEKKI